uniref:EB domain-containing protein n=1 Tax=Heterorhabditis bacteriophora TaxID=37862 RepID=A0A1I7WEW0_HETBA
MGKLVRKCLQQNLILFSASYILISVSRCYYNIHSTQEQYFQQFIDGILLQINNKFTFNLSCVGPNIVLHLFSNIFSASGHYTRYSYMNRIYVGGTFVRCHDFVPITGCTFYQFIQIDCPDNISKKNNCVQIVEDNLDISLCDSSCCPIRAPQSSDLEIRRATEDMLCCFPQKSVLCRRFDEMVHYPGRG